MKSGQHLAGAWRADEASVAMPAAGAASAEAAAVEDAMSVARIAAGIRVLAGSDENAVALVTSVREGADAGLVYPTVGADPEPRVLAFSPPTGPMPWHDVRMALMLVRDALVSVGVLRPTGEQLHAALLGGEVDVPGMRVVAFRGVLRMRAEGDGWGRIASERFQRRAISRIE